MVEIQNVNDMHVRKMDVLQSQISRLILNLWTLTTSNAWRKRPMIAIEQMELKLESKHKYEYHEHQ
jgi:hypothetical protein